MALKIKNLMHKFEYNFDFLSSKPGQSAGKFLVLVYACFFSTQNCVRFEKKTKISGLTHFSV